MFDLRNQLEATGIYSDADPVSRGELKAYERQLNDFLTWQQQMKCEFALDTTVMLLPRWEKIYAETPETDDTIRDRQLRLLNKRRAKGVLTPANVESFAADYGFKANVVKHIRPYRYSVEILRTTQADLQKLHEVLNKSEPGHQSHEFSVNNSIGYVEHVGTSGSSLAYVSRYRACGTFDCGGELGL